MTQNHKTHNHDFHITIMCPELICVNWLLCSAALSQKLQNKSKQCGGPIFLITRVILDPPTSCVGLIVLRRSPLHNNERAHCLQRPRLNLSKSLMGVVLEGGHRRIHRDHLRASGFATKFVTPTENMNGRQCLQQTRTNRV